MNFATHFRHLLTFLAGIATLLLVTLFIKPEASPAVQAAVSQVATPPVLATGALGVILARVVIAVLGILFPAIAEKLGNLSGGIGLILVSVLSIGLMTVGLVACSSTVTSAPDGTRTKTTTYDPEAAKPFLDFGRDLFTAPAPVASPVIPLDAK